MAYWLLIFFKKSKKYIVKIGQNTEKNSGDARIVVTQTPQKKWQEVE